MKNELHRTFRISNCDEVKACDPYSSLSHRMIRLTFLNIVFATSLLCPRTFKGSLSPTQERTKTRPFLRGHSGQGAFFLSSTVNCRLTVEHSEMTEVYRMRSPQHWSTGPRAAAAGDLISLRLQKVRMLPRLLTLQLSVSKAGDGEETAVFYVCAFLPLPPPSISRAFSHSPGPS